MTFTGIVRNVDRLGRIVLPKKIRQSLKIAELTDPIEIQVSDDFIVLKKSTDNTPLSGNIRCLDNFGRIVIPIEIRTLMGIVSQVDSLEIYLDENCIKLKKHQNSCIFCGGFEKVVAFEGKMICSSCINSIKKNF